MPFESRGKIHLSILTTSLYPPSRVVGQRNQLNNTEWSRQDSKLRERGIEQDQQEKGTTAWNGQCELQLGSQVGFPTLLGGVTLEVPSRTPERLNIVA